MSILISVKNSQNEFVNTGMLFQGTWYVDDKFEQTLDFRGGLETGIFCGIKSGNSKCRVNGNTGQPTLYPATASSTTMEVGTGNGDGGSSTLTLEPLKASGIIYKSSPRDRYGRTDDLADETRLHPYGKREDLAIGLLKKGVIEVSVHDGVKEVEYRIFRSVDEVTTETVTSGDVVVPFTPGNHVYKVGNKVEYNGEINWIAGVDETANELTLAYAPTVDGTLILKGQIGDPVYLNTFSDTSVDKGNIGSINYSFEDESKLPFTAIPPQHTGATINQVVGFIESPIAIRVDLSKNIEI
jgi:hypothetical protein